MTLEQQIQAHYQEAGELRDADPIRQAGWEARLAALQKLQAIQEAAAWLARDMNDLVQRIDTEGLQCILSSSGVAGSLAAQVDLGAAELAGLKSRLDTLHRLAGQTA